MVNLLQIILFIIQKLAILRITFENSNIMASKFQNKNKISELEENSTKSSKISTTARTVRKYSTPCTFEGFPDKTLIRFPLSRTNSKFREGSKGEMSPRSRNSAF